MPRVVDERERKERIAEAVWKIADERGLHRATVRDVAAEAGLSVGSVQHYFRKSADLYRFAMELVVDRVAARMEEAARACSAEMEREGGALRLARDSGIEGGAAVFGDGAGKGESEPAVLAGAVASVEVEALAVLAQLLPLDDERLSEARTWLAFSAEALTTPDLAAANHRMMALVERVVSGCVEALAAHGERARAADAESSCAQETARLQALLDGMTLQLLADPSPRRRAQCEEILREEVRRLTGRS